MKVLRTVRSISAVVDEVLESRLGQNRRECCQSLCRADHRDRAAVVHGERRLIGCQHQIERIHNGPQLHHRVVPDDPFGTIGRIEGNDLARGHAHLRKLPRHARRGVVQLMERPTFVLEDQRDFLTELQRGGADEVAD